VTQGCLLPRIHRQCLVLQTGSGAVKWFCVQHQAGAAHHVCTLCSLITCSLHTTLLRAD
jgi:hypothetical protein